MRKETRRSWVGRIWPLAAAGAVAVPMSAAFVFHVHDRVAASFPAPACVTDADRQARCVVDGDTFWLAGEKIRIENIDAPETHRSGCDAERELGKIARLALQRHLTRGLALKITRSGKDRYGRTLARVSVNGRDAGEALVAAGLAVPWEGRMHEWCASALPGDAPLSGFSRLAIAWHGMAWLGGAGLGLAWHGQAGQGVARHGWVRLGTDFFDHFRLAKQDLARQGQVRLGRAWRGQAWHGMAGHGQARHRRARISSNISDGRGVPRSGTPWRGGARRGKA